MTSSISIVVPCHNAESFLRETLDSALHQTCPPREVIVVDDGSTDDSAAIAQSYGPPVRVVRQSNQGAARARHVGVDSARGDLIAFLDAGDVAPPIRLEVLSNAMVAHPRCVLAFGLGWNRSRPMPARSPITGDVLDGSMTVLDKPLEWLLARAWPMASKMNVMASRGVAHSCTRGRSFFRAANDYDFQIRAAQRGPFVHVAAVTGEFVIRENGITDRYGPHRQMAYALCSACEAFRDTAKTTEMRRIWLERIRSEAPSLAGRLALQHDWRLLAYVLRIASQGGRPFDVLRGFWWALDQVAEENPNVAAPWLRLTTQAGRGLRVLLRSARRPIARR